MSIQLTRVAGRAALPLLLLFCTLTLTVGAAERGFPLISVYPAEVHKAGPQNFDIAQDRDGILYFGNLHGLVIYDGAWWRLLKLPDDQVALSLAADDKGRVAIGLVNDFGYLVRDAQGTPLYRSLLEQLPAGAREVGDVRDICSTSGGFLYVTERSLLLWDGAKVSIAGTFAADAAPRGCESEGGEVLLRGPKGLQRFDPATRRVTPTAVTEHVQLVLRRADGKLVVAIREQGLFLVDGDTVTLWAPAASAWLKGDSATGGARLNDGRLAITARQAGLAILDANGGMEQVLRDDAGLPDALIREAMVDREGSLWLAMEGPIVRIDVGSPVSIFDARRGIKGGAADVTRFNGRLYAATSYGVHVIDDRGNATLLEGLNMPAWRTLAVDDELLIANSKGLWSIGADGARKHLVDREAELYDIHRSEADPSRVWIAERYGVSSIRRTAGGWQVEPALTGMPQYTSSVLEHDGVLWCGSTFNGVLRIDDPRGPRQRVQQFGDDEMNVAIAGGRPVYVHARDGQIVALNNNGKLIPDPLLGHINAPGGFFVVVEDARGNIWINSTPPRVFERQADGKYAEQGRPLVSVTAADIQTLRAHADGVVWFASDKGLFRYDPATAGQNGLTQPAPRIRRVVAGENRLLYGGVGTGAPVELGHKFGRMRLEFAPVSYRPGVEYQYRLDPIDSEWSEWTAQTFIDYTTLEPNDYTFRLRARGAGTAASEETRWSFSVRPPWYRTTWAYVLWTLLAAGLITLIISVRTAALRRQAETLRARVAEKTAELQETVQLLEQANTRLEQLSLEDDLTGIANRRSFDRALSDEWNRARRREHPLALILLDLDHFKELNDRRGHPAGDDGLRRVGAFLAEAIRRSGEVVARYGGEEFAILLPATDAEGAIRVAESLREGIEQLSIPYGNGRRMTASCGVAAMIPARTLTAESLVASADRALYAAKHGGRNCVRVADETTTGTWLRDVSA